MTNNIFTFVCATKIVFGQDASQKVGEELAVRNYKKTMIVTDQGIVKAGLLKGIIESISNNGIEYIVFDEVPPNPPSATVVKGVEVFRSNGCDSFVAVGGGSAMDACKTISMMTVNEGDINEYDIGGKTFTKRGPDVITVPTTSGTGSEVTQWAVITDEKKNWKSSIGSPLMAPAVALVDPMLTLGLPPAITAATGVDALTHAIEAYTAKGALNGASPIADTLNLAAVRLIGENLREAYARGENYVAREKVMLGSTIAGIGFPQVGLGNAHALAHPLGGHYDIPHGVANAILLPYVMKFNLIACPSRFADIAVAMGENIEGLSPMEAAEKAVAAVQRLVKDTNIPSLKSFNIEDSAWSILAEDALKDMNSQTNPRKTSYQDLLDLFHRANDADIGEEQKVLQNV
ncbi:iron-containing alcohol dehydrogenase [Paenibacillus xerothermodurans]|uniref:Iron-containing alcohol dehydrogenase n=1 Tax=Paenibacillus xerothermodurans TaxID=1977292 RepID=A0A2W1NPR6_PAEXE|nr:iron-containing alcohol dehydrogenase [Paenibacillus xerothermodurans]PZE20903.1 iron-containing alcohol dehydrogenase [Paenibacillus xerothermodurans]